MIKLWKCKNATWVSRLYKGFSLLSKRGIICFSSYYAKYGHYILLDNWLNIVPSRYHSDSFPCQIYWCAIFWPWSICISVKYAIPFHLWLLSLRKLSTIMAMGGGVEIVRHEIFWRTLGGTNFLQVYRGSKHFSSYSTSNMCQYYGMTKIILHVREWATKIVHTLEAAWTILPSQNISTCHPSLNIWQLPKYYFPMSYTSWLHFHLLIWQPGLAVFCPH